MKKKCCICRKSKFSSSFYHCSSNASGLDYRCKKCDRNRLRVWRKSPRAKALENVRIERVREQHKRYRQSVKGRKVSSAKAKRMAKKYPEKFKARYKLRYAVSRGTILRKPCEVCGNKVVQGHHEDYSKPLVVKWLCDTHHKQVENKLR